MTAPSRLARFRNLLWCALGGSAIFAGSTLFAEGEQFDFDLPAAPSEAEEIDEIDDITFDDPPSADQSSAKSTETTSRSHILSRPLSEIRATIAAPAGLLPKTRSVRELDESVDMLFDGPNRPWALTSYQWEAPATRHLPLLFEEPNLERLGYAYGFCDCGICEEEPRRGQRLQALVSFVHFFGRVPFIPYMAGVHPLTEPYYTLGVDRPGSPVPYREHLPHCSTRGALYQAGAAVGAVFIIP